jgi:5-methyltetrahydropteroyltriglutamate--homocysteine methyltransferase
MIDAHLTGVFPRSEKLVDATRAAVRGNLSQTELDKVLHQDIISLVDLQEQSALTVCVDGQLNWQDLFRPFSELLTGIEPGGLTRWFDNNTFYRKPIIANKVEPRSTNLENYFRGNLLPRSSHRKAILPGPLTFALLSENRGYSSLPDLVEGLAHALKNVVNKLRNTGYEYFQFNEPVLCSSSVTERDFEVGKHAFETCARAIGGKTILHTYFGDAGQSIEALLDFPVDSIDIDFYATSIDSLKDYDFDKVLGCGCIDGRNSLLESPSDLSNFVSKVREKLEPDDIYVAPNCDLEFLPQSVAEKKVRLLSETRKLVA